MQGCFVGKIGGMQNKATAAFDRAAKMHLNVLDGVGRARNAKLLKQFGECDAVNHPIDHQPHRTVFIVRTDIDNTLRKARITHARHCDQQLPTKIFACCAPHAHF